MLLEQVTAQPTTPDGTPFLWTAIGWGVTLLAAVLPTFVNIFHHRKLRKDVDELKAEKAQSVDRARYYDERLKLIDDLGNMAHALEKGLKGLSTLSSLESTLTTVKSYAERLKFSCEDKHLIQSVLDLVMYAQERGNTYPEELRPAKLQAIIEILKKGAYLQ